MVVGLAGLARNLKFRLVSFSWTETVYERITPLVSSKAGGSHDNATTVELKDTMCGLDGGPMGAGEIDNT